MQLENEKGGRGGRLGVDVHELAKVRGLPDINPSSPGKSWRVVPSGRVIPIYGGASSEIKLRRARKYPWYLKFRDSRAGEVV